ncbi:hypothetical protein BJ742DRAFT_856234 [Cladochytrium replicatum]|nr:hypothetical protein BJ742DRAFT_856234 [Cladochytrium replicatum]
MQYDLEGEGNEQSVMSICQYHSRRERRLLISEQVTLIEDEQNPNLIMVEDSEWGEQGDSTAVVSDGNRQNMQQQLENDQHTGEYPYAEESPDLQFVEDVIALPGIATQVTGSDRPLSVHDSSLEPEGEMLAHHGYGNESGEGYQNQELMNALVRIQELEATLAIRDATIEHRNRTAQDRLKGMEGALGHFRDECSRLEQVIIDAQNDRDTYLDFARELQAAAEKSEDNLRRTLQELAMCKEELDHWKRVARDTEDRAYETAEKARTIKEKLDSTLGIKEQAFQHFVSFVAGVREASTALGTLIPPRIHETS